MVEFFLPLTLHNSRFEKKNIIIEKFQYENTYLKQKVNKTQVNINSKIIKFDKDENIRNNYEFSF